jgi:hypothetical protein
VLWFIYDLVGFYHLEKPHRSEGDQNNPFNINKNPKNTLAIKNNSSNGVFPNGKI